MRANTMNIVSPHAFRPSFLSAALASLGARCAGAALVASAALLLAVASQCSVHVGATLVPLSAQPQMVLLLAAWLGPARSLAAVVAWLSMAASGLPVLAGGASAAALLGPTAGYLYSYLPATWLVARFGRGTDVRSWLMWQLAGAVILAGGASGLSLWFGAAGALAAGVAPFVWADFLKMSAAFLIYRGARRGAAWCQARR